MLSVKYYIKWNKNDDMLPVYNLDRSTGVENGRKMFFPLSLRVSILIVSKELLYVHRSKPSNTRKKKSIIFHFMSYLMVNIILALKS